MSTLLHIDSSPRADRSISRKLTHDFATSWKSAHPGAEIIYRDLGHQELPYVTEEWVAGAFSHDALTPEQQAAFKTSDELIAELKAADHYLFGIPMYNFTVPAIFKSYIDQVTRFNQTVTFADGGGFEGLLKNKKATVIITSGGIYREGTPFAPYNFVEPYMRTILGFLGVTDVTFVVADGVNEVMFGKLDREAYLKPIRAHISELASA